jgi:hypothetical protein
MDQLSTEAQRAMRALEEHGVLLMQDRELPNLVSLVVGSAVSGSWWAHPASHDIFRIANEVAEHSDVCIATLVQGKRTFVHRACWPALFAIGRAREAWQLGALDRSALDLLGRVDAAGTAVSAGAAAKRLEQLLLVASEEVHTPSGKHAKQLMTWARFAKQRKLRVVRLSVADAKAELEEVTRKLASSSGASARLPWQ